MGLELVKTLTLWVAVATEAVAGAIVAIAVVEAAIRAAGLMIWAELQRSGVEASHEAKEDVRLRLARWLALALEFELGADILRTAVAPTWSEIGQLAAIAAVRTALNYFLQREIDAAGNRRGGAARGQGSSACECRGRAAPGAQGPGQALTHARPRRKHLAASGHRANRAPQPRDAP